MKWKALTAEDAGIAEFLEAVPSSQATGVFQEYV
jgi:hypothetical protein